MAVPAVEAATRVERLRDEIMERKGSAPTGVNPFTRSVALWRASGGGRSCAQVRAACLLEQVRLAPIQIEPEWRLVGNHLPTTCLGFESPDPDNTDHMAALRTLGVTGDDIAAVRQAVEDNPVGRNPGNAPYATGETRADMELGRGGWGGDDSRTVYWANGWIENHSIRDYAKVLRLGYAGIREEVEEQLARASLADPEYPQKENFWRAALDICEAGSLLGRRYTEAATHAAEAADSPEEQMRLESISEACERVPERGARTLAEAAQSLWLAHVLTCGEDGINANSLGRLDQVLFPYYEADLAVGRLTREDALEQMEELACRLYLEYDVQAITLGGVDADGHDAVNEMSYLILEATRNVGFARDLSVRLHRNSPSSFTGLAAELIAQGGGIPFLFNDECYIPALVERGIELADARNYAPIGCIELTVPGRANPHAVSGWFNSTKCLELALFDGCDPQTGEQLGPRTGALAEMADFEQLFLAYCRQVEHFSERMVYWCNRGELAQREGGPLPCWSVLTDDCIERGRDITDGGAVYDYHSICLLGTANTADSLMVLRKLVLEEGQLEPEELLTALRANFEGREDLRQMLLSGAPKYGNDHPEVDELARRVDEHFIEAMDRMRSPLGGRYFVHLFSFRCHLDFGRTVGATPDGRQAQEPLAYSLSAHQGRDVNGVTALLNSLARLPHARAAGASAAIVELEPSLVEGEIGVERLRQLIESAVEMGVGQIQWNVCTVERLQQAQDDPERYGNLTVRVAGYSQMFKLIPRELQDHIIARTKHTN